LGFYDLRVAETRIEQAELARDHGIEGFCYWHYWFNGKRLLEKPFNQVLSSKQPDFPFCLAWANETWSRRWLGEERDILIKQTYSTEDDYNHIKWLIKAFSDPRYIRVKDRPLFLVYRPHNLPDPKKTTDIFRNECIKNGTAEPYLIGVNAHNWRIDSKELGFDGTLNFEPALGVLPYVMSQKLKPVKVINNLALGVLQPKLNVYDYSLARRLMLKRKPNYEFYPCIFVGWDNTPRRGKNGVIITNSTPELFESGLSDYIEASLDKPYDDRLIFINAWNEWAEGNHLEPDVKNGNNHLEAVKRTNTINGSFQ
jgi:lipopolysaccharide biosynthesis protein